jgi:hypothetical protein
MAIVVRIQASTINQHIRWGATQVAYSRHAGRLEARVRLAAPRSMRVARPIPFSAARNTPVLTRTYHEPISGRSSLMRLPLEPADVADRRHSAFAVLFSPVFQIPKSKDVNHLLLFSFFARAQAGGSSRRRESGWAH